MKWTAESTERVHFFCDGRVFDKGGGVVGFVTGIDDERAVAAPVFVVDEAVETVDVM